MSARYEIPAATRVVQARASDPAASAWVSANAGSGKTTVLVRRVIRLLLAGNPPTRILCLTFTKAAAAHMANEVLKVLGAWVRLDDKELDRAIVEVSPLKSTPELRARARRLFAAALETPGGLKVQTIHAFCDRVLHQFPFEARVPAGFEVLDEIREADLLTRARNAVLIEAAAEPMGALGRALAHAVSVATDTSLEEALQEAVRARREILRLVRQDNTAMLRSALDLKPDETIAAIETTIVASPHLPSASWPATADSLRSGSTVDQELADRIRTAAAAQGESRFTAYLEVFLTRDGTLRSRSRFFTKKIRDADPGLADRLEQEFDRIADLLDKYRAAMACERTAALLVLAAAMIRRYEQVKRDRGELDYADLIHNTAAMFDDVAASWVLYKLDGGIDHVLIDEAQDTSPEQWEVIGKLTEEFFAGRGAREDRGRTIFAVGDEKQSIFGFQGAEPARFDEMRREFKRRVEAAGAIFHPERLGLSFRSAPGILSAIDSIFSRSEAHRGLSSAEEIGTAHTAIRSRAPALVEIWPVVKPADDADDGLAWDAPLDAQSPRSAPVVLAQHIAKAVKYWLGGGLAVGDARRPPRPGDVIVLVRQRGPLFEAILQALKRADVPVAGADRLKLTEHIAVMDLLALGDALTLEGDDLALACALKSPLFGLSEDELFDLAHGRERTLAASLAEKSQSHSRFAAAAEKLRRWRGEARGLRPFDFFSRVLGRDHGREQILSRLGMEAVDALDEFLARALAYEATETPSLTGFLAFLRRAGTEVKRDLEVESATVRVMTVHGAKGLEAPIIVLADTASAPSGRHDPRLLPLPVQNAPADEPQALVWALKKDLDSMSLQEARAAAQKIREAEYRRLLYVALTRAADVLVVCGHESARQGESKLPEGCWYNLAHEALKGSEENPELIETKVPYFDAKVWRWRPQAMRAAKSKAKKPQPAIKLAPWIHQKALPAPRPLERRRPSDFDRNDAPPTPYAQPNKKLLDPRERGNLLHRLLQFLPDQPPAERGEAARRFLTIAARELASTDRDALAAEALAVLEHPDLAALFGAESRAELDILARLAEMPGIEVSGRIDRLAITPEAVLIADYKTDATPPRSPREAPDNYVKQLALYRAVLKKVYPKKALRAYLIWTAAPAIHEIPAARLDAALKIVTSA
jgi:ATP-dependent helicase/nuclease subunit A